MNLKILSNDELHSTTKQLAQREREITLEVLHHIKEIEYRKYHLFLGYNSVEQYCIQELKYSGGAAHRRINAMRILKDIPDLETKVESGELTLTNLAKAQTFFTAEQKLNKTYSLEEKNEVVQSLENKSTREAEITLLKISPDALAKDRTRQITEDKCQITAVIDNETQAYINKLMSLYSHKYPNLSLGELLKIVLKEAVEKKDPARKFEKRKSLNLQRAVTSAPDVKSRYIPSAVRREIWYRDGGKCTFTNHQTGRKCDSNHKLEVDHIKPFALGGLTKLDNLRLLCSAHNKFRAEETFGKYKGLQKREA